MVNNVKALNQKRKSNSVKTPTKNGVTGANLKVARDAKAAKKIRLQKEENLIAKKRKQKDRVARKQKKKYGHRVGFKKKPAWK